MTRQNRENLDRAAARNAYARSLSALGKLLRRTRTRRRWTLSRVAERTGLPKRRLMQYEAGTVAIPYWHALSVSYALKLRVSEMVSALSAPLRRMSSEEFRKLLRYAKAQARPHWSALRKEWPRLVGDRFLRETTFADVTLAGWPEFLPPLLENELADTAASLQLLFNSVLEPIFHIGRRAKRRPKDPIDKGESICRQLRYGLKVFEVNLHWVQQRHRALIPRFFKQRIQKQRTRLRYAMELLARYEDPKRPVETSVQEKKFRRDFWRVCMVRREIIDSLNELARQTRQRQ